MKGKLRKDIEVMQLLRETWMPGKGDYPTEHILRAQQRMASEG